MSDAVEIMARAVWTRHCKDLGLPSRAADFPLVEGHAEYMANAKAALSALEAEGYEEGPRPIETAPIEGEFLAENKHGDWLVVRRFNHPNRGRHCVINGRMGIWWLATRWRPLASAPKHGGGNGEG